MTPKRKKAQDADSEETVERPEGEVETGVGTLAGREPDPAGEEASSEIALEETLDPEKAPQPEPRIEDLPLDKAVETLLFITDRPLTVRQLNRMTKNKDAKEMRRVLESIREDFEKTRAIRIVEIAGGWQMATRKEFAPAVRKLFQDKMTFRLSAPSLETLAIIAYKQPITRAEIEQIRGVEVVAALETLEEKGLIKPVGRKETVGRPILYGTTQDFLRHFELGSLKDLPPIERFVEENPPRDENAAETDAAAPVEAETETETEVAEIAEPEFGENTEPEAIETAGEDGAPEERSGSEQTDPPAESESDSREEDPSSPI